jgi:asparagine synthase (glutamine-hydrolysing)
MCGIAGIFSGKDFPDAELLKKMSESLSHRGPDGERILILGRAGLVHRRLSIIDLSENAAQPMCNEDETLWLIFNGEIFNYIELRDELSKKGHNFSSESDSEVILHSYEEWGDECTKKFNGMWAFAIYDSIKDELFCSRDRFGVKPFYYAFVDGDFLFASEIKALLYHPDVGKKPCNEKLLSYLASGALDTDEKTMFDGVFQLRPATGMYVRGGVVCEPKKYWDFNVSSAPISPKGFSDKSAAESLLEKLYDSVRLRLRSDVPVGTCLSGGIDSSTITLIINSLIKKETISGVGVRQKTFSACYSDPRYDESSYMDIIIDSTGVSACKAFPK